MTIVQSMPRVIPIPIVASVSNPCRRDRPDSCLLAAAQRNVEVGQFLPKSEVMPTASAFPSSGHPQGSGLLLSIFQSLGTTEDFASLLPTIRAPRIVGLFGRCRVYPRNMASAPTKAAIPRPAARGRPWSGAAVVPLFRTLERCRVAAVEPQGGNRGPMYKCILIPTDVSEFCDRAIRHGVDLAKELQAKVVGLTVTQPLRTGTPSAMIPASIAGMIHAETVQASSGKAQCHQASSQGGWCRG